MLRLVCINVNNFKTKIVYGSHVWYESAPKPMLLHEVIFIIRNPLLIHRQVEVSFSDIHTPQVDTLMIASLQIFNENPFSRKKGKEYEKSFCSSSNFAEACQHFKSAVPTSKNNYANLMYSDILNKFQIKFSIKYTRKFGIGVWF